MAAQRQPMDVEAAAVYQPAVGSLLRQRALYTFVGTASTLLLVAVVAFGFEDSSVMKAADSKYTAANADAWAPSVLPGLKKSPFQTERAVNVKPSSTVGLGMAMEGGDAEYKPIIPTPENSMAPDYAKEMTQFERQGLVDKQVGAAEAQTPEGAGPLGGLSGSGLTRREVYGTTGAVGAGLAGVLWAVTRDVGYDKKSSARAPGKVTINAEAVADPKIQEAISDLKEVREAVAELLAAFNKDKNAKLSEGVAEFEASELRNNLNAINLAAFDEDTQLLTDRLSRGILQDFVELEQAVKLKEGATRSPKRVASTQKRLGSLLDGLDKFLAYFKKGEAAK